VTADGHVKHSDKRNARRDLGEKETQTSVTKDRDYGRASGDTGGRACCVAAQALCTPLEWLDGRRALSQAPREPF
jgi:hypothetical protein